MRVLAVVFAVIALSAGVAAPALAQAPVPVPETPPGTPAAMFVDDPAIVDAYPTRPQAWSRTADPHTLRLHFTSGTPECYGVTATVRESPDAVTIDLRSGTRPQAIDRACIMIAVFGGLDVPLQQPLGTRTVLSLT